MHVHVVSQLIGMELPNCQPYVFSNQGSEYSCGHQSRPYQSGTFQSSRHHTARTALAGFPRPCQGPALASSADGWAKEGSEKESGIGTMFGHVETLLSRLRCHSVRMK